MSWIVALIISFLLWSGSFLYLRSYTRRRTDPRRVLADYAEEAERIAATIDAATDRDARLVEARIKTLRSLLEDTDRRLATFAREMDRRTGEDLSRVQISTPLPPVSAPKQDASAAPSSGEQGAQPSKTAIPAAAVVNELPFDREPLVSASSVSSVSLPAIRKAARPIQPAPPTFPEQVSALHRKGMSVDLIAQTLNAAQAEVEFAVALVENAWKGDEAP